jgi:hypothetical protein
VASIVVTDQSKSSRGVYLFLLGILAILLVLMFLGLLAFGLRQSLANAMVSDKIAELRSRGIPVDNASLQAQYDRNAYADDSSAWTALLRQLDSSPFKDEGALMPILGTEAPIPLEGAWDQEEMVRKFLARWDPLYGDLVQIAQKRRPIRTIPKFDSFMTLLTAAQQVRQAARLAQLRAMVALRDGDSAELLRANVAMRGMSASLSADPFLISQMVESAVNGIALNSLQEGLERGVFSPGELDDIAQELRKSLHIGDRWRRAVQGERAGAIPVFDDPARQIGKTAPPWTLAQDRLNFLEFYESAESVATEDLDEFQQGLMAVEQSFNQKVSGSVLGRLETMITSQVIPAFSSAGNALIWDISRHRLAAVACGLRQYEGKYGTMPEKLESIEEFGWSMQELQPLGGKPFGYRTQPTVVLWGFNSRKRPKTPNDPFELMSGQPDEEASTWIWNFQPKGSK